MVCECADLGTTWAVTRGLVFVLVFVVLVVRLHIELDILEDIYDTNSQDYNFHTSEAAAAARLQGQAVYGVKLVLIFSFFSVLGFSP